MKNKMNVILFCMVLVAVFGCAKQSDVGGASQAGGVSPISSPKNSDVETEVVVDELNSLTDKFFNFGFESKEQERFSGIDRKIREYESLRRSVAMALHNRVRNSLDSTTATFLRYEYKLLVSYQNKLVAQKIHYLTTVDVKAPALYEAPVEPNLGFIYSNFDMVESANSQIDNKSVYSDFQKTEIDALHAQLKQTFHTGWLSVDMDRAYAITEKLRLCEAAPSGDADVCAPLR